MFRQDPGLRAVAVRRSATADPVLLSRSRLSAQLSGPYGFGQALYERRTVSVLAPAQSLVLPADLALPLAAQAVLARDVEDRYEDVVVRWADGALGLLPVAALFERLTNVFQALAMHDALTGLPNRTHLEQVLDDFGIGYGLVAVAEGVERVEQLETLADLGCDQVQGFLLGRPAVDAHPGSAVRRPPSVRASRRTPQFGRAGRTRLRRRDLVPALPVVCRRVACSSPGSSCVCAGGGDAPAERPRVRCADRPRSSSCSCAEPSVCPSQPPC